MRKGGLAPSSQSLRSTNTEFDGKQLSVPDVVIPFCRVELMEIKETWMEYRRFPLPLRWCYKWETAQKADVSGTSRLLGPAGVAGPPANKLIQSKKWIKWKIVKIIQTFCSGNEIRACTLFHGALAHPPLGRLHSPMDCVKGVGSPGLGRRHYRTGGSIWKWWALNRRGADVYRHLCSSLYGLWQAGRKTLMAPLEAPSCSSVTFWLMLDELCGSLLQD